MGDYDQDTAFLGKWGPFQQAVFFLLCASTVPNGLSALSIVFLGASPSHHCLIPGGANISERWREAGIPTEEVNGQAKRSGCQRFRLDLIANFSALDLIPGVDVNLSHVPLEGCVDGWTYSEDFYQTTIVTEFDLVCSNEWKQPFTSSVFFMGVLCGSFLSGQLSDRFGRKPILFITMAMQTVFTFIQVFSPNWEVFSLLFFIVGLGQISNYVAAFVLGSEILSGQVRVLYSSLGVCLFFAIGYMILPLIAFFIRDWRMLLVAMSVPGLIYIPLWWFIPESPRWLLSQGRVEEAEAILRDAARRNGVTPPEVILTPIEDEEKKSKREEAYSVLDLFRGSDIRYTTFILFLVWLTLSSGYLGLSLSATSLHGNPYLNCFISAAIEVPAYIVSWLSLKFLPRRLCTSASMLLGGGMLLFIQLVPLSLPSLSTALEMIGKFGLATGSALIFVFTGELYPTVLRNTAVGACSMVARLGGTITPFLIQLSKHDRNLPRTILGSLALVSAAIIVFLPETFGQPLPDTIDQMQKRQRILCTCSLREHKNQKEQGNPPQILVETSI
ncbi:hypothetical protein AGOR_G00021450 [Albula goreensis]|uniref:Major facilitator superfamily (MFS) profile domain-containing protein n=1 Tax=Albula goreensis TaxID=1534307 RepID=A0A8T3E824_9TELE|nr:hypothetical protein AGOR_G00021450 [Albula goreensis]